MNPTVEVSKATAVGVFGSVWCLDRESETLREHLGKAKPAFHLGETFASAEEVQNLEGLKIIPLPGRIRLPRNTPIAVPHGRELRLAATSAFLLRSDGLMTKGLRIERRRISSVEYRPAPAHLAGSFDFVAGIAFVEGDPTLRLRIEHDPNGHPFVSGVPQVWKDWGWTAHEGGFAFIDQATAEAEADCIARKLCEAADWRRHSREACIG